MYKYSATFEYSVNPPALLHITYMYAVPEMPSYVILCVAVYLYQVSMEKQKAIKMHAR